MKTLKKLSRKIYDLLCLGCDQLYLSDRDIIKRFHTLFYDALFHSKETLNISWAGIPVQKNPLDLWVMQEIIHETRPDIIIESGTGDGGSALYLAHLCELAGHGKVITIDIEPPDELPRHERIRYFRGSSVSPEIVMQVRDTIQTDDDVMVILDAAHQQEHVLEEMRLYGGLVTTGNYLIVEDTHFNGHPIYKEHGPGPMEAVEKFLQEHENFQPEASREKFYLTFNPNGYLKKVR